MALAVMDSGVTMYTSGERDLPHSPPSPTPQHQWTEYYPQNHPSDQTVQCIRVT